MEIMNKKSILTTLDDIIENLKSKLDGIPEANLLDRTKRDSVLSEMKEPLPIPNLEQIKVKIIQRTLTLKIRILRFFMHLVIGKGGLNILQFVYLL
jgi:hypothetical protein